MKAIFKKEIRSYFKSPLGYVFIGMFALVSALFFFMYNILYGIGDINYVFSNITLLLVLIIPVLTMRTFTEEKSKKTDRLLFTSPTSTVEIVAGKFLACLSVFALALALTLIYPIILSFYAQISFTEVVCTYLGFLLMGGAFISIGIFVSSLTDNAVVSACLSFGALFVIYIMDWLEYSLSNPVFSFIARLLSLTARYSEFAMGIINISHFVYFLSVIFVFGTLTVLKIEKRE